MRMYQQGKAIKESIIDKFFFRAIQVLLLMLGICLSIIVVRMTILLILL